MFEFADAKIETDIALIKIAIITKQLNTFRIIIFFATFPIFLPFPRRDFYLSLKQTKN
jgi:hypothetical protein